MSDDRTLIRNVCAVTMDPELGTLERADLLIERGQIQAIARDLAVENCQVVDGTGRIAIPGMVDTHRHLSLTQLRGVMADYTNWEYLSEAAMGYMSLLRAEDVYVGSLAGALEALESGVTTVVDHADCVNAPGYGEEVVRAHREARIRSVLLYGTGHPRFDPTAELDPMAFFTPPEWHFEDARRVQAAVRASGNGRVRFGITMHAAEGSPVEMGRKEIEFGREIGAHLIGCNAGFGLMTGNVHYVLDLGSAGLLGPDMLIIHANGILDEELDLLAQAGAAIAAEPENELQVGAGFPIIGRAIERGVQTSLGIDVVAGYRGDLFTQMRFALQAERHRLGEEFLKQGLLARTNKITARDVLELATLGGARAANLDAEIGSLTPGKQADIVLIRTDRLGLAPVTDPVKTVVSQANAADVDTVFVAGEAVKRDGKLVAVDVPPILERLAASRDYLIEEKGRYDNGAMIELAAMMMPLA